MSCLFSSGSWSSSSKPRSCLTRRHPIIQRSSRRRIFSEHSAHTLREFLPQKPVGAERDGAGKADGGGAGKEQAIFLRFGNVSMSPVHECIPLVTSLGQCPKSFDHLVHRHDHATASLLRIETMVVSMSSEQSVMIPRTVIRRLSRTVQGTTPTILSIHSNLRMLIQQKLTPCTEDAACQPGRVG